MDEQEIQLVAVEEDEGQQAVGETPYDVVDGLVLGDILDADNEQELPTIDGDEDDVIDETDQEEVVDPPADYTEDDGDELAVGALEV